MSAAVGLPPAGVAPAGRASAPADRAGSGAAFAATFEQLSRRESREPQSASEPILAPEASRHRAARPGRASSDDEGRTSAPGEFGYAATTSSRNEVRAAAGEASAGTAAAASEADRPAAATGEPTTAGPTDTGHPNVTPDLDAQPPSSGIPLPVPAGSDAPGSPGNGLPTTSALGAPGAVDEPSAVIAIAGIQDAAGATGAPGTGAADARVDVLGSAGTAGPIGTAGDRDGARAAGAGRTVADMPLTVDAAPVDAPDGGGTGSGTPHAPGSGGGATARLGEVLSATTEATTDEGSKGAGGAAPGGETVSASAIGGDRSGAAPSTAGRSTGSEMPSGVEGPIDGSTLVAARPGHEPAGGTAPGGAAVSGGAVPAVASARDTAGQHTAGQHAAGAPNAGVPAALVGTSALTATAPAQAPASAPLHGTAAAAFAAQLTQPVLRLASTAGGERSITVRVAPEELGPVTVRAVVGADGVRIELTAAGDAGREALRQVVGDLRRDLAATGSGATLDLGTGTGRDAGTGDGSDGPQAGREASASPATGAEARRAEASAHQMRAAPAWHPTSTTLDTLA